MVEMSASLELVAWQDIPTSAFCLTAVTFAAQDDVDGIFSSREVKRSDSKAIAWQCQHFAARAAGKGRRPWQRLKHGEDAQTVTMFKRNYSPEGIVIIDPAVGRLGRLKEDDGKDAVRR